MDVPKDYPMSKDIIDRRQGQKPSLGEKARDVATKVRTDWNDMKQAERNRNGQQVKQVEGKIYPSYKKGGKIKKTGLAYVHKGEKVVPKKISRKKG